MKLRLIPKFYQPINRHLVFSVPYVLRVLRSSHNSSAMPSASNFESRNILQLRERSLIATIFPSVKIESFEKLIAAEPQTCYCGFDPTAISLHIGNLLGLIMLMHCQRRGHNPIVLIGSATALIGDPSDKTSDRNILEASQIASNSTKIECLVQSIFQNHEAFIWKRTHQTDLPKLKILNNIQWYENLNVIKFMSMFGKQLRMGDLISRKQMENRLKSSQGINYSEFSYQVFQAFDWFYLLQNHNCTIQIGGNDQTGNMKTGHELISKLKNVIGGVQNNKSVFSLTFPIVTSEKGEKLGKSSRNAVWLDPTLMSPFEFYQFFVNTSDQMVSTYLKMFTFLPLNEIEDVMEKHMTAPENYHAQRKLAYELTLLVHGEEGVKSAQKCTNALFYNDRISLALMSQAEIDATFKGCSITTLTMDPAMTVTDCVLKANCFRSIDDAVHIIKSGGLRINSAICTNPQEILIYGQHILENKITIIRVGKKNYYLIKWVS